MAVLDTTLGLWCFTTLFATKCALYSRVTSLQWLSELGQLCTTIKKMLSIYAAFDTSKFSADLKYVATGDLSTPHMLRPSELAGGIFPALMLTGARLQAAGQAVGRGRCCEKGLLSRARAQLLAMHWPSADGMAGCCPKLYLCKPELLASRSCLKPPRFVFLTNLIHPCITLCGGNLELACGLGISSEYLPRSKNGIEINPTSGAQAICEVLSHAIWHSSSWPYLRPQLQLGCTETACLASALLLKPNASTALLSGLIVYSRNIWGQKGVKVSEITEEGLRSIFQEAICGETAITGTKQLSGRASDKVVLCVVKGHYC